MPGTLSPLVNNADGAFNDMSLAITEENIVEVYLGANLLARTNAFNEVGDEIETVLDGTLLYAADSTSTLFDWWQVQGDVTLGKRGTASGMQSPPPVGSSKPQQGALPRFEDVMNGMR